VVRVSLVRTVRGDVDPSSLGRVDVHEHLVITEGPIVDTDPETRLDDIDDAIREAEAFRDAGGGTIVDALPATCGRDATALAAISDATGINVVATTGFYRSFAYPERHWARRYPVDVLTSVLLGEIRDGIDHWDLTGPAVESTEVRPGVIKLATGLESIDPVELRMLRAVAAAHRASGLPILTHAERGTFGSGQLDLLEAEGVHPTRVMVGHLDRRPDLAAHRGIAARGAFLGYDGLARDHQRPFMDVAEVIRRLIEMGFGGQLLLGGDVGRRTMRRAAGGPGIAGVLTSMAPELLARGIAEDSVEAMLVTNPARYLQVVDHVH
jgi:phosphotriesterase-related protein